MGKTPILQLETSNSTTDASQKFLTYRMNQNGDINSNMTKIDSWADTVNKKVKELQDRVSTVLLNANWVSLGYYEATTLDVTELKANMLFTIRLNKDNDGTTTIKVNRLTTKSLLKYDSSGVLVNLIAGDLKKNKEYQFRYDGTSFVWQSGVSGDQVNVGGVAGNLTSIGDDSGIVDSSISTESILIRNHDESEITQGVEGYIDADALGGRQPDYFATKDEVSLKVDKTQVLTNVPEGAIFTDTITEVINTLTETVVGKALDATQGKILNGELATTKSQLNEIATELETHKAKKVHQYEEGVFTPIIFGTTVTGSATYSVQQGRYTKVDKTIMYSINLTWTNHTGTGTMRVGGLPFINSNHTFIASTHMNNITIPNNCYLVTFIPESLQILALIGIPIGGGTQQGVTMDVDGSINITGFYKTN